MLVIVSLSSDQGQRGVVARAVGAGVTANLAAR